MDHGQALLGAWQMTVQRHEGAFGSVELDVCRRAGVYGDGAAETVHGHCARLAALQLVQRHEEAFGAVELNARLRDPASGRPGFDGRGSAPPAASLPNKPSCQEGMAERTQPPHAATPTICPTVSAARRAEASHPAEARSGCFTCSLKSLGTLPGHGQEGPPPKRLLRPPPTPGPLARDGGQHVQPDFAVIWSMVE